MRSKEAATFTQAARREQMIQATIETVAEVGFHKASLARIAERMGIAKGGIIYHFSSRDELIRAALQEVFDRLTRHMLEQVERAVSLREAVWIYVVTLVGYLDAHRDEVRLISEGFAATQNAESAEEQVQTRWSGLADILDQAVAETGRPGVDTKVLAITVSGGIDALVGEALRDPGFDLRAAGERLAEMVDHLIEPEGEFPDE
ncbi:TetR/AcrR family transcriptional regulator [Nocardiopsis metallicus]|uniref:AcrR family transcriptional regulator n=1 Tax=Nocardiopsis metallicus TaxID=179819 RepID=A0A840WIU2_9ACTN|nr:TetR/AcrR family transcriptional regulator [Nocardiopsis metallicus]MBB5492911.1 AcrR family transcriptional regulator [Nocardiopsis metallicus]